MKTGSKPPVFIPSVGPRSGIHAVRGRPTAGRPCPASWFELRPHPAIGSIKTPAAFQARVQIEAVRYSDVPEPGRQVKNAAEVFLHLSTTRSRSEISA